MTYKNFITILNDHKNRWIPAKKMCDFFGMLPDENGKRKIREFVAQARANGVPVISGDSGYKLAVKYADVEPTVRRLEAHGKKELLAASRLKKTFGMQVEMEGI